MGQRRTNESSHILVYRRIDCRMEDPINGVGMYFVWASCESLPHESISIHLSDVL